MSKNTFLKLRHTILFMRCIIVVLLVMICLSHKGFTQQGHTYPRTGVFHWGGCQPEWYAKFDIVISLYNSSSFAQAVKEINPDIILLPTTDWNVGAGISNIPDEWVVKDSQGNKVRIYGDTRDMIDMSDYCPRSAQFGNRRYNEYLPIYMVEFGNLTWYDGVATDGVYDHPRGTGLTDCDLDRNGVNDWEEHGESWLEAVWLAGVNKVCGDIRNRIGPNKIIHLNSGAFHSFCWSLTNGMTFEHNMYVSSWKNSINNFNNWFPVAPEPHTSFKDGKGDNKNDFYWMRFLLGTSLYGGYYFSFSDADSREHYYDKYYDEFDLDFGYPTTNMVKLKDFGTNEKGIWVRFFDNGAVIVNISATPDVVTDAQLQTLSGYNGPYYRFKGGQDPEFNNGELFTSVDLSARLYGSTGYVGDAIFLLKEPKIVVSDIIVDNVDAGTSPGSTPTNLIGNWTSKVDNGDYSWGVGARSYRGIYNYATANPGSGNTYAEFIPNIGVAGNYEVFEWHGFLENDPSEITEGTNVYHSVTFKGGTKGEILIDQSINYDQWNKIGTFYFDVGTNGKVVISNDKANGPIIADAIKFVYIGEEMDAYNPNEPRNLNSIEQTLNTIHLTWSPPLPASDGDIATAYEVFRNGQRVGRPIANSFIDTGLQDGTAYTYQIYTYDNYGNRSQNGLTGIFMTNTDNIPPEISLAAALNETLVRVEFSEPVDQINAENPVNYNINSNILIFSATLNEDQQSVQLTTSEHVVGSQYILTANNIYDRATTPNLMQSSMAEYTGVSGDTIRIAIAADNEYELYINGNYIGDGSTWSVGDVYSIPVILGDNLVAIKGIDTGGDAGMVAEISFDDKLFVSDETWRVSTSEESGWYSLSFNDITWPKATSFGLHGTALPWASYKNVQGISTTNHVHWIWSADNQNDNVVYFRRTLKTTSDNIPPVPPSGLSIISQ